MKADTFCGDEIFNLFTKVGPYRPVILGLVLVRLPYESEMAGLSRSLTPRFAHQVVKIYMYRGLSHNCFHCSELS